ncbi:MAG: DNA recombination protein RmuC [Firmicutes bacterium]|nr:DNA recombination protein RmuC [Bacillota bacterium]
MTTPEILGLISVIFGAVSVGLLFIIFLRKHKESPMNSNLDALENSLTKQVDELKMTITKSLFESMFEFNKQVNHQLLDTSQKSSDNITEFRLNVNKELVGFQEKINEKLTVDFKSLTDTIDQKMYKINEKVEERLTKGFSDTNQTFLQIAERVKVIDDAQKKIESLSNEMIGLQNILSNNQARGSFGEYQLNQLLYSVFADNDKLYQTQYTIKEQRGKQESVRADAVVFMPQPNKMIAIDSKFPFSSYSKLFDNKELSKEDELKLIQNFGAEVKKHITDISSKYIISGVTADYALMFVASDGILALLHSKLTNVIEYARNKYITIVSPTTLIPLLSSYKAVYIDHERSKYANEINLQLLMLNKEFKQFGSEWNKLNSNIQNLTKQSDSVNIRVEKINSKFSQIKNVDFLDEENPQKMISNSTDEEENL